MDKEYVLCGSKFDEMWRQISANGNPFEDWMLANGYSPEIIDHIYRLIDSFLTAELRHSKRQIDPTLN